ncbi:hypothetical protein AMELA_G00296780 [Ameiurus melas]|uniref:Reverse transcriptase domain-containing protein n=1 Tax=Ameiurus melas TaxID=219545 RepID=A0A7J5ZHP7_AMEME|nr:hypothetical protein AMELA_G00296780 [Ameiurus melas]
MLFADDLVVCGETRKEMVDRLEVWRSEVEDRGMRVSRQKTEYLFIGKRELVGEVKMQGEKLKRVEDFKYLGSTVQTDGGVERERGNKKDPSRVECLAEDNWYHV